MNKLIPEWPAPLQVKAFQTTRLGGVSIAPFAQCNLGCHVGDNPQHVQQNRSLLDLPGEPLWLNQVHGKRVVSADQAILLPAADACIARKRQAICAIMTADCLPVLLCDRQASVVAAAHAGWKGLAAGVIEATVAAMEVAPQNLLAWLGPAISQEFFEVGDEVRSAFLGPQPQAASAFVSGNTGKWFADIYALARLRLNLLGIQQIYGGEYCTYREREKFFSYRREGVTGRMGTFIWLE